MQRIKGIDVSKWQGTINWKTVALTDIKFAMIRSSFGWCSNDSQIDSYFERNYKGCKDNKIPCGAYHYSYAKNKEQAIKEAQYMLKALNNKTFEFPIAFDIEEDSILNNLTRSEIAEIIKGFCETMENAGYYVVVYSSKSRIEQFTQEIIDRYDIWIANWDVPEPKTNIRYGMWQYSSKGNVAGIQGNVDLNYCYKDYPTIMFMKNLNGHSAVQKTDEKDQTQKDTGKLILKNEPLYTSSTAQKPVRNISGTYYLYDGKKFTNNRYRITNKKTNCGEKPIGTYVTGYIEMG